MRDALGTPARENEKSIRKFKRRIAEHKEKIVSPEKYYKDWDELKPGHQANVMKDWSTEIKGWEEQIEWLEEILEERVTHGE